ncbi:MAG: transposase [Phycisphaerales bacterium]
MGRKRHTAEEVVNKFRLADVELAKGTSIAAVCKQLSVSEQTYYHWRKEYGGLKVDQATRFKDRQQENVPLKRLLTESEPDRMIKRVIPSGTKELAQRRVAGTSDGHPYVLAGNRLCPSRRENWEGTPAHEVPDRARKCHATKHSR